MTDGQKIHRILKYVCSLPNKFNSVDTNEISKAVGLSIAETNILSRQLIDNNDARDASSKDNGNNGTISLLPIQATRDAFEANKYLQLTDKEIILQTIEQLKLSDKFVYLPILFNELGITDDIKQEYFRDILLQKGLTKKSNHSDWHQQITEPGRQINSTSYDRFFVEKYDKQDNIKIDNLHIGDNFGNYNQASLTDSSINQISQIKNKAMDSYSSSFWKWLIAIVGLIASIATIYQIFFNDK